MGRVKFFLTVGLVAFLICQLAFARDNVINKDFQSQNSTAPAYGITQHRIGNIGLGINNNGTLGTGFSQASLIDFFTGETVRSSNFPVSSNSSFLFGGSIWVGAVVGSDTLVSVGADGWNLGFEMHPDEPPFGDLVYRSTISDDPSIQEDALSEEDYIAVYYDTLTAGVTNDYFGRPHIPLNLEITQRSFAWSYPYAQDFILIQYDIKNIGNWVLKEAYIGIFMDHDVHNISNPTGYNDDITGYMQTYDFPVQDCSFTDSINLAWMADNDGDPLGGTYGPNSVRSVTGVSIVRTVMENPNVTYNWYRSDGNPTYDFGPREKSGAGLWPEDFRDFQTGGLGTPSGDANKYYMLKNKEIDYDQIYTASITETDPLWMYPENQPIAEVISTGADTRYLLSFGPAQINPGETIPFIVAYVGGEYFHTNPTAINNLPDNPDAFYSQLNFDDIANNARWADWAFDNPGVDTDGDGYSGKFWICCHDSTFVLDTISWDPLVTDSVWMYDLCDTVYYCGDGVPDYRAAGPPQPPDTRYEIEAQQMIIRWNGLHSETNPDFLTHQVDFEGYNVYLQDGTNEVYEKFASYDLENYSKYIWTYGSWSLRNDPFTAEELRCLYGTDCNDLSFDPMAYTESSPFVHPLFSDSIFYFAPVGDNNSELGVTTPILKTYPSQPYPTSLNPEEALPSELTDDGYLKYFEYEITIDLNQDYAQPSMCYTASVTAFDYGSVFANTPAQESSKEKTEFYGCIQAKAELAPDTIYYLMAYAIEPVTAELTLGFDAGGIPGKILNSSTFDFGFPIDSFTYVDSPEGFTGQAKRIYINLTDYLRSIELPFDTTFVDEIIPGNYFDGQETTVRLQYILIGHRLGDVNANGEVDIADLVYLVRYMYDNGPPPRITQTADFNKDGIVDIEDLVAMVTMMFL